MKSDYIRKAYWEGCIAIWGFLACLTFTSEINPPPRNAPLWFTILFYGFAAFLFPIVAHGFLKSHEGKENEAFVRSTARKVIFWIWVFSAIALFVSMLDYRDEDRLIVPSCGVVAAIWTVVAAWRIRIILKMGNR